jgi:hypothetical protein
MSKKASDLLFGTKNEELALPLIENFLNCKLQKTRNYYISDFVNETYEIELKSRRVCHNQYAETKLGNNKIKYFEKSNKQCFIFYYFTDGLFYIQYDKDLFKTFEVKKDKLIRDGNISYCDNIFIPIKLLKKVV